MGTTNLTAYIIRQDVEPDLCWEYRLPNGRYAFVYTDRDAPLRFLLQLPREDAEECGLTTEQVEARLVEIAALDPKEGP